jgi:hypothetical protein
MAYLLHSPDSFNRNYLDWQVGLRRAGVRAGVIRELRALGINDARDLLSIEPLRVHRCGRHQAAIIVGYRGEP